MVPKSGIYKIESVDQAKALLVNHHWVTQDNASFYTEFRLVPNGELQALAEDHWADAVQADIPNASTLEILFFKAEKQVLEVVHEILANGFLKISHKGFTEKGQAYCNTEVYHKQLSVLPYAASVGSVAIRPTKEGVIKHKALSAMEDQTNMQLDQIRQQIELLARQAQEIRKRKELSLMIYEAKLNFKPQIGQVYHLYERKDGSHLLSLVAPEEWGGSGPFKQFVSSVKLLADHTWVEIGEPANAFSHV